MNYKDALCKYLDCDEKKCIREWIKYKGDNDHNEIKRGKKPDLYLVHCYVEGCHNIYHAGKNGWKCSFCSREICDAHLGVAGLFNECGDEYCCKDCDKFLYKGNSLN
jgi:hypothetical protein